MKIGVSTLETAASPQNKSNIPTKLVSDREWNIFYLHCFIFFFLWVKGVFRTVILHFHSNSNSY